jgi:hypothetical protein
MLNLSELDLRRFDLPRHFLLLLLAADLMFVLIHAVHATTPLIVSSMYALTHDRGYAEAFQYIKLYWIILALAVLLWRTRAPVYAAWVVVFGYLLLDDALQIHEVVGNAVATYLGYRARLGLRTADFGELTVTAVAGLLLLGLLAIGYLRSGPNARSASRDLLVLIAALAFFGVFVDVLHQLAFTTRLDGLLGIAEDGGEMIVVSVACAYSVGLLLRGGVPARAAPQDPVPGVPAPRSS